MNRRSTPLLRVVPPTLEPGQVLLERLAELSASSSPTDRDPGPSAGPPAGRGLPGAATVAVVAVTTWVAGAVPRNKSRDEDEKTSSTTAAEHGGRP